MPLYHAPLFNAIRGWYTQSHRKLRQGCPGLWENPPVFPAPAERKAVYLMEIVRKTVSCGEPYPLARLGDERKILFIDIETTGFSRENNAIYLIGCGIPEGNRLRIVQFFADRGDEAELLDAFFRFLDPYRLLIHFNGKNFDLPFIRARAERYGIRAAFPEDLDIYQEARKLRGLLALPGLKQKDIERFLGIRREDKMGGGELIGVYQDFLHDRDGEKRRLLLLHNADDVAGMPEILPILSYRDFLSGGFALDSTEVVETPPGQAARSLRAQWTGCTDLPVPVHTAITLDHKKRGSGREVSPILGTALLTGRKVRLTLPLYEGELRHFYPDYKDYYYFADRDCAIHRSIAKFMDSPDRRKATAKTCYTRASGIFLPEPSAVFTPVMQQDYHSPLLFAPWREDLFSSPESAEEYVREVLRLLL